MVFKCFFVQKKNLKSLKVRSQERAVHVVAGKRLPHGPWPFDFELFGKKKRFFLVNF